MQDALSPLDGRYRSLTEPLAHIFSERGLHSARAEVEMRYLISLSQHDQVPVRSLEPKEKDYLLACSIISLEDFAEIIAIEKTTRHDVKALEYFLKSRLENHSSKDLREWIHFALTSEDVNNLAYSLMLARALGQVLVPSLEELIEDLSVLARAQADTPMLARTHGQPATPTTFGKEIAVFIARLMRQLDQLKNHTLQVKFSGATGAWNAHRVALEEVDWPQFTRDFIMSFDQDFQLNLYTTQIEPHDSWIELFDIIRRVNYILVDLAQDMWRYISDGWIIQANREGEVGSSTMPHKINPIQFENAEGNLAMANGLLTSFGQKLAISRLQRDLSDSTVERNLGSALGYSVIAYRSLIGGLARIAVNEEMLAIELEEHMEVVGEAIQTILRAHNYPEPYELLKQWTQGKEVTLTSLHALIAGLDVDEQLKEKLMGITPANYTGYAAELTRRLLR